MISILKIYTYIPNNFLNLKGRFKNINDTFLKKKNRCN